MDKISFEKITAFFKKLRSKKPQGERQLFNPMRDWQFIFIANFVLLIGLIGFGIYTFFTSNRDVDTALETEVVELESVDVEELDAALEFFAEKKDTFDSLVEQNSAGADPF